MDVLNNGYDSLQRQLEQLRNTQRFAPTFNQPATNIVWVQGVEGAKGYQVPNRSNTILLDSENENTMYIVSADEVGMRKMRVFHFEEIEVKQPGQVDMSQYCTKDDVRGIILEMLSQKESTITNRAATKDITREARHDQVIS